MKNLYLLPMLLLLMAGCSLSDEVHFQENPEGLPGRWMLVETSYSSGAELQYQEVKNGGEYTFLPAGTFTSIKLDGCGRGKYELKDDKLTLTYHCDPNDLPNPFVYSLTFKDDYFILSPLSIMCIEGCPSKFKKKAI